MINIMVIQHREQLFCLHFGSANFEIEQGDHAWRGRKHNGRRRRVRVEVEEEVDDDVDDDVIEDLIDVAEAMAANAQL